MIKDYKHLMGLQHPPGTNAFKVCESEMMIVRYFFVEKYANCPFYDEIVLKSQYKTCN